MSYSEAVELLPVPSNAHATRPDHNRALLSGLRDNNSQDLLVGGVFALYFSQYSDSPSVWFWLTGFALIAAARLGVLRWLETAAEFGGSQRSALIYLCIGATALAWGFAPLACANPNLEMSFVVAVSWVAIIVIAGAQAFPADRVATAVLALPATVPSLVILISRQDRTSFAVLAAIGLVYAHLTIGTIRARRALLLELRLKHENAALMQQYRKQARLASEELERRLHIERELRAARHRAERLSSLDALTGIANRRHFDAQLNIEFGRAFRARKAISIIVMDVDCFKQFNDSYGHGAGDDCLAGIGEILARFARRRGDIVARYGGEEFVLLLPESDAEASVRIAENLRQTIIERAIPHRASEIEPVVTASFGVATLIPTAERTAKQLLEAADEALYDAKKAGRNCVVSAG